MDIVTDQQVYFVLPFVEMEPDNFIPSETERITFFTGKRRRETNSKVDKPRYDFIARALAQVTGKGPILESERIAILFLLERMMREPVVEPNIYANIAETLNTHRKIKREGASIRKWIDANLKINGGITSLQNKPFEQTLKERMKVELLLRKEIANVEESMDDDLTDTLALIEKMKWQNVITVRQSAEDSLRYRIPPGFYDSKWMPILPNENTDQEIDQFYADVYEEVQAEFETQTKTEGGEKETEQREEVNDYEIWTSCKRLKTENEPLFEPFELNLF